MTFRKMRNRFATCFGYALRENRCEPLVCVVFVAFVYKYRNLLSKSVQVTSCDQSKVHQYAA